MSNAAATYPVTDEQLQYIRNWLTQNPPTLRTDQLADRIHYGNGSPEGVILANPGDLYLDRDGGASVTLYVKESGTASMTGWIAK